MRYNTNRVKQYKISGSLKDENHNREKSNVFFVLAILRQFFPERFSDAKVEDKPDIQGKGIGVEVTFAESSKEMKANSVFSALCEKEKKYKSEEIIKDCGYDIKIVGNIPVLLQEGTGTTDSNYVSENIKEAIKRKKKKISSYRNSIRGEIDLAIRFKDLIPWSFIENIPQYVYNSLEGDKEIFDCVFVVGPYFLFIINLIEQENDSFTYKKIVIEKDVYKGLEKIARMTVEKQLDFDSEEWN